MLLWKNHFKIKTREEAEFSPKQRWSKNIIKIMMC